MSIQRADSGRHGLHRVLARRKRLVVCGRGSISYAFVGKVRRAARTDSTQSVIVGGLRACGAYVWIIGLPVDLLVGWKGKTLLMECKSLTGKKAPKPKRYTELQKEFMAEWKGLPVATVTSIEEAITALRA